MQRQAMVKSSQGPGKGDAASSCNRAVSGARTHRERSEVRRRFRFARRNDAEADSRCRNQDNEEQRNPGDAGPEILGQNGKDAFIDLGQRAQKNQSDGQDEHHHGQSQGS